MSLVAALAVGACAPTIQDTATGSPPATAGIIAFATPDTLARTADSRLVAAGPVALSGELTLPGGAGPFPPS